MDPLSISIPRESGDDPCDESDPDFVDEYSPRERG